MTNEVVSIMKEIERQGIGRMVAALAAVSLVGCIIYDDDDYPQPTQVPHNYGPELVDAQVVVGYDDYYAQCFWDFFAWVDDPDGYGDVVDVYVDVVDAYDPSYVVERFLLALDDGGQWSNTIYLDYSGAADCRYPDDYLFDFYVFDSAGSYDTIAVYPDAPLNSPPYFDDARVETGFDSYWQECFWDFLAWVDDPDGYQDITSVSVDVIDIVYAPGEVVESFPLANDGRGQWSDTIYLTYSGYADCGYPDEYEYDFWVFDSFGDYNLISF